MPGIARRGRCHPRRTNTARTTHVRPTRARDFYRRDGDRGPRTGWLVGLGGRRMEARSVLLLRVLVARLTHWGRRPVWLVWWADLPNKASTRPAMSARRVTGADLLPVEILELVARSLSAAALLRGVQVSRIWREAFTSDEERLWEPLARGRFPRLPSLLAMRTSAAVRPTFKLLYRRLLTADHSQVPDGSMPRQVFRLSEYLLSYELHLDDVLKLHASAPVGQRARLCSEVPQWYQDQGVGVEWGHRLRLVIYVTRQSDMSSVKLYEHDLTMRDGMSTNFHERLLPGAPYIDLDGGTWQVENDAAIGPDTEQCMEAPSKHMAADPLLWMDPAEDGDTLGSIEVFLSYASGEYLRGIRDGNVSYMCMSILDGHLGDMPDDQKEIYFAYMAPWG
jgi:hypothetical protein